MAIDRRIIEAIDACRPGSNDLDAPEMNDLAREVKGNRRVAAVFESLQRWDAKIDHAIGNVPVPEGLEAQILAQLALDRPRQTVTAPVAADPVAAAPARPSARRAWFAVAIAASLAMVLATAWYRTYQVPVTANNLTGRVDSWLQQIDPSVWRAADSAPEGYPASPRVLGRRFGWQPVGAGVVAYNLAGPGAAPAVLLVVRARIDGLPRRPPTRATWTQNRSRAAWQSGRLLYVLVVDGPPARYRRLLDLRRPPLA